MPSMFALAGMLAGNFGAVIHDGLLGCGTGTASFSTCGRGDRLLPGLRARGPPPPRPAARGRLLLASFSTCGTGGASPSARGGGFPFSRPPARGPPPPRPAARDRQRRGAGGSTSGARSRPTGTRSRQNAGARSFAGALQGALPSMFALAGMLAGNLCAMLAGNFGAMFHDGLLGLRHGDRLLLDLRRRDRLPLGLRAREPPPARPAGAGTAPPSLYNAGAASSSTGGSRLFHRQKK